MAKIILFVYALQAGVYPSKMFVREASAAASVNTNVQSEDFLPAITSEQFVFSVPDCIMSIS